MVFSFLLLVNCILISVSFFQNCHIDCFISLLVEILHKSSFLRTNFHSVSQNDIVKNDECNPVFVVELRILWALVAGCDFLSATCEECIDELKIFHRLKLVIVEKTRKSWKILVPDYRQRLNNLQLLVSVVIYASKLQQIIVIVLRWHQFEHEQI